MSSAPRLYLDSGLHFTSYAGSKSVSVQYWTTDEINQRVWSWLLLFLASFNSKQRSAIWRIVSAVHQLV